MEDESPYELFIKGKSLLEDGHPAQAVMVLEKALAEEPRKGSILENLGRAYFLLGHYNYAANKFEMAIEVDPTNDYAHYCLGLCCLKLSDVRRAAKHFKLAWYLRPCDTYREIATRFVA